MYETGLEEFDDSEIQRISVVHALNSSPNPLSLHHVNYINWIPEIYEVLGEG